MAGSVGAAWLAFVLICLISAQDPSSVRDKEAWLQGARACCRGCVETLLLLFQLDTVLSTRVRVSKSTNARPRVVLLMIVLLARTSHHPVLSIICGIARHVKRWPVTRCLSYGIGTRRAVDSGRHFSTTTPMLFFIEIVRTCHSWEVSRASVVHVSFYFPFARSCYS